MALVSVTLYNKMEDDNTTKKVIAKKYTPKVIAKNWYQINTNSALKWIVTFNGNLETFENFDSCIIGNKKFSILNMSEDGINKIRMEVGI